MPKHIFLQHIEADSKSQDDDLGYMARDRLVSAIGSIIKKIKQDMGRANRLRESPQLVKEEKEKIDAFLLERLSKLIDQKSKLIELQKKISEQGKEVNLEDEIKQIKKALPEPRS